MLFDSLPHSALADQIWYGLEKLESDAQKDDYVSWMLELTSEHKDAWKAWCLLASEMVAAGDPMPRELARWVSAVLKDRP